MVRGQPFQYMPLTDLGQAIRDIGLAYLQGMRSPEEMEKERVLALQAQLAIDQARQKIEAERRAQLARQGLANTLAATTPDPALGAILRNAAMMSGDPAVTAGFAAMPGAIRGSADAMAPWYTLFTGRPIGQNDALTVPHQAQVAARNQANELARINAEAAARASAEERLIRLKHDLAQQEADRELGDLERTVIREAFGVNLPPGVTARQVRTILDNVGKMIPASDLGVLVGAVTGKEPPPGLSDRGAEGGMIPTELAQTVLSQATRGEVQAAKDRAGRVPIAQVAALYPELAAELARQGIDSVSQDYLDAVIKREGAAKRADSALAVAKVRALGGVAPVKLGDIRRILAANGVSLPADIWPDDVELPSRVAVKFIDAIREGAPIDDATAEQLAQAFGLPSGTLRGLPTDAAVKAATGAAAAAAANERNALNARIAEIREQLGFGRLALHDRELDLRERQQADESERWRSMLGFKREEAAAKHSLEEQKLAIQRELARLREQEMAARGELERLRADRSAEAAEARARIEMLRLETEQRRQEVLERRFELEARRLALEGKKFVDRGQAAALLNEAGVEFDAAALPEVIPTEQLFELVRTITKRKSEQRSQDLRAQQSAERLRLAERRIEMAARDLGLKEGQFLSREMAAGILEKAEIPIDPQDLPDRMQVKELTSLVRAQAALTRARGEVAARMATTIPRPVAEAVLSRWGLRPEDLGAALDTLTPQTLREVTRGLEAAYRAYDLVATAQRFGISGPVLRVLYETAGIQPPENFDQVVKSGDLTALTALAKLRRDDARRERRSTTPWSDVVGIARSLGAQIDDRAFAPGHEVDVTMARAALTTALSGLDQEKTVSPDTVRAALAAVGGDPTAFVGQPMTVRELVGVMNVFSRHATQMERLNTAKALAAARAADQDRLSPKDRMKMLGDAMRILKGVLQGVDGRRSKMADAVLQDPVVMNQIVDRALSRSAADGRSLSAHIAEILQNELVFRDNWLARDEVSLLPDPQMTGGVPAQAVPQAVAPGGPASVLTGTAGAAAVGPGSSAIMEAPSDKAALRALPDGAHVRDPITGLVFVKRGDRLVLVGGGQQ